MSMFAMVCADPLGRGASHSAPQPDHEFRQAPSTSWVSKSSRHSKSGSGRGTPVEGMQRVASGAVGALCQECEEDGALKLCRVCDLRLCRDCSVAHQKNKYSKMHELEELPEGAPAMPARLQVGKEGFDLRLGLKIKDGLLLAQVPRDGRRLPLEQLLGPGLRSELAHFRLGPRTPQIQSRRHDVVLWTKQMRRHVQRLASEHLPALLRLAPRLPAPPERGDEHCRLSALAQPVARVETPHRALQDV